MRPLPLLSSNLKSKQLQVNDSPENCQILVVAWFFFKHRVSVHLFLLQFLNIFFLILLFIVER